MSCFLRRVHHFHLIKQASRRQHIMAQHQMRMIFITIKNFPYPT
ncbi:hypothetical protein HMPREF0880_03894 [Yokenella regensburgei ATCC 43003]|nr:hypothetical protein HMPREF0880_03894 [Yokenella regensburgei ATCC 43003]